MRIPALTTLTLVMIGFGLTACSDYKDSNGMTEAEQRQHMVQRAEQAADQFRNVDPSMENFFESAAGYVVFPSVKKGAAGIGAARGKGVLFEGGEAVGRSTLSQGTIGAQLGGQTYREIIFFQDGQDVEQFKGGDFEFSAQASAVAATKGAAANADYDEGVAVFTMARGGLMFEASVGGQKFTYRPFD